MRWSSVVVGIDFSPGAMRALLAARDIGGALGAPVDPVYVTDRLRDTEVPRADALGWLDASAVPSLDLTVREGVAWIELARYAHNTGALMIVVGTDGRSGLQTTRIGSTAARLALTSTVPLLLVGPRTAMMRALDTRRDRESQRDQHAGSALAPPTAAPTPTISQSET